MHADKCGGCTYQGKPSYEQLKIKDELVKTLIDKKGLKVDTLLPIEKSPNMYRYRNKMEFTFGNSEREGELKLGFHEKGNYRNIVNIEDCQLVDTDYNEILDAVRKFVVENNFSFYDKKSHSGFLRHLVIRSGIRTSEIIVNLVTSSSNLSTFNSKAFVSLLTSLKLNNKLVGILHTVNDNIRDTATGEDIRILYGRDYYMERIMELDFKVRMGSFFQTNVVAAENLYKYAIGCIDDVKDKVIFDLFCGTGTITQSLSGAAKKVIGVDISKDAIKSAIENTKLNKIKNISFFKGDVFEVIKNITEKPDVIVLDPPRAGVNAKALEKIVEFAPREIVYISCNPKTLIDNLYYFEYNRYNIKSLKAFDNFFFTSHVEAVALLSKLDVDKHIDVEIKLDELDLTSAESKVTYKQI